MEIRYISSSENREEISKIYENSWKYAYEGIIPQNYLDSVSDRQWIKNIDTPGWFTMVCIENGEYIGTSSFCRSRLEQYSDSGEIISIYFLPKYIGRGYGNKLLDAVMNELKVKGFEEVFLWVLEDNNVARQFYEKNGFKCSDDFLVTNIGGKELREVRYVFQDR